MKFQVNRNELLEHLKKAAKAARSKGTMPILSCVLLRVDAGVLTISATDLELRVRSRIEVGSSARDGGIAVNAKNLIAAASNMSGELITVDSYAAERVEVTSGRSQLTIEGFSENEYPSDPSAEGVSASSEWSQDVIRSIGSAIKRTAFAASNDASRPHLCGVLLNYDPATKRVCTAATDGHRLHVEEIREEIEQGDIETRLNFYAQPHVLIPNASIASITDAMDDDPLSIEVSDSEITIITESGVVSSKLVAGNFPAYRQIIPSSSNTSVTVDKELFARACSIVSIATDKGFRRLSIVSDSSGDELIVRCEGGAARGVSGSSNVAAQFESHELFRFGVDALYLKEAIAQARTPFVKLSTSAETSRSKGAKDSPGSLKPIVCEEIWDDEKLASTRMTSIVMPMRI